MRLYGSPLSPFSMRVDMLARAKSIELEHVRPPGGPKGPEYVKINPIGKIPTLVDGDLILPESEVICEYLEDLFPERALRPKDPEARAKARLIARICDIYVFAPALRLRPHTDPEARDQEVVDSLDAEIRQGVGFLEHYFSGEPYAAGPEFSGADCAAFPILYYLVRVYPEQFGFAPFLDDAPKLLAYWERMQSEPAAKEAMEAMDVAIDEKRARERANRA